MTAILNLLLSLISISHSAHLPATQEVTPSHLRSDSNINMRVLLTKGVNSLVVRSSGGSLWVEEESKNPTKSRLKISSPLKITASGDKVSLSEGDEVFHVLKITGDNSLGIQAQWIRGSLIIYAKQGQLLAVNHLPLREYLISNVGSEMHPKWEKEALKAQAVASRSYALYMKNNPRNPLYDVESTINDQVYLGDIVKSPSLIQAIDSTDGEYLSEKELPMKAFYHSRCGGHTSGPENMWANSNKVYRSPQIPCPYCQENPFKWQWNITREEFMRKLNLPEKENPFLALLPLDRSSFGRLMKLKVQTRVASRELTAEQLRALLGFEKLKSNAFQWQMNLKQIGFSGIGLGHGVGLCQWGAKYFAQKGKSYRMILSHYYPYAGIRRLVFRN
jgi:stage II sporulation protein D